MITSMSDSLTNDESFHLPHAPIIEAVVDIDCDLPPSLDFAGLEAPACDRFRSQYPKLRTLYLHQVQIELPPIEKPEYSAQKGIQALQFLHEDEKQLVQVRPQGYSFNRLAPYGSLDDYLPEIERNWWIYVDLTSPVLVRLVRLRYINRFHLPLTPKGVELDDYLAIGPKLPDETALNFTGFVNQHAAVEIETGNQISIVLASQPPEVDGLPLIFDITVVHEDALEPQDWQSIRAHIDSLRRLKNRIFKRGLTEKCIDLFR